MELGGRLPFDSIALCVILDACASRSNTVPGSCDTPGATETEAGRAPFTYCESITSLMLFLSGRIGSVGKSAAFVRKDSRSEENSPIGRQASHDHLCMAART